MSVEKARNNYIGRGYKRMTCAESVATAFQEKFDIDDQLVDSFATCGRGNAPGGVCGAYYAAKRIVGMENKEKAQEFEQYFLEHAGALECHTIRGLRKLSCVGCVEKSAEFLEKMSDGTMAAK